MLLSLDRLSAHLRGPLAKLYLIAGAEPLLIQEAADAIRATAKQAGYNDRQVFFIEPGFDWSQLSMQVASLSLFAERQLLEVRLEAAKPDAAGARALIAYAQEPPPDTLLLVVAHHLDGAARASVWYKALEKAGVAIQVWPVERRELMGWTRARLHRHALEATQAALELLIERTEGNLLAARQEIEKLALLYPAGRIDEAEVLASVGDSARFNVFQLVDAALAGQGARTLRLLESLQLEGVEPPLLLWALLRELDILCRASFIISQRSSAEKAWNALNVRERRRPLLQRALARHPLAHWHGFLTQAVDLDRIIKGLVPGNAWLELRNLYLAIAGERPVFLQHTS
jgi:DNA polymerase-3 subunit delta